MGVKVGNSNINFPLLKKLKRGVRLDHMLTHLIKASIVKFCIEIITINVEINPKCIACF